MSVGDTDLKAFSFDKTGTCRVIHDGVTHTIRPPKWGAYKRIRDAFTALADLDQQRVSLLATAQDAEATPAEQGAAMTSLMRLSDQLAEEKGQILLLVFNGHPGQEGRAADDDAPAQPEIKSFKALSDIPLPADPDEWESWLLANEEMLPKLLEHWQTVPLASSAR